MNRMAKILVFIASTQFVFFSANTFAEEASQSLNPDDLALAQAQDILRNRTKRDLEIKKSPKAMENDEQIRALTGGDEEIRDQIYNSASDILKPLSEQANFDSAAMQQMILKAAQDPEAFFNSLPEEEQKKIRDIAGQMPNFNSP